MLRTACIAVLLVVLGGCTASPGRTRTGGFERFVGADDSLVLRSTLSWAWFRPPDDQWRRGAHTWRCDVLRKGNDAYPGDRLSEVRSRDYCSDSVGAWLNYPVDYDYGYTWFHEAEWRAGNRRAICWAKTDQ